MTSKTSMPTKNTLVNLEKKYGCIISLQTHDFTLEKSFLVYRENEQRIAASSIKLFFAVAVMSVLKEKGFTLESVLPIKPYQSVRGISILADFVIKKMSIHNLLYLLLAHSDTSAQNALEQVISPEEVNNYIQEHNFKKTLFVSNLKSTKTTLSLVSPADMVNILYKLWAKEILKPEDCELLLSFLAQSRMTHFSLRFLPTSINTGEPVISKHYSKAGKLYKSINDSFILETDKGVLGGSICVDNFTVKDKFNSVDHEGILLISKITKNIFYEWYYLKT
jgi:beta-lactamase class A